MKILFLGAGGVGGYFGGRLIESGVEAHFLLRPARKTLIESKGLRIQSPHGDLHLRPRCLTVDDVRPVYDFVVLAPKAYDLDSAMAAIAPAVGDRAFIVPFLNGMTHMEVLDRRFGRDRVLGGVAHIAAELSGDGAVRQLNLLHSLTIGGRDPATHEAAARFDAACAGANFDHRVASDIEAVLWEKWAFLATLAGLTTLMSASVGEIVATTYGEDLVRTLYEQCMSIAAGQGKPVSLSARQKALAVLTEPGSDFTASMLRDLRGGLRTEHDHVLGELLRLAGECGVESKLLAAAYTQMQVREAQRAQP